MLKLKEMREEERFIILIELLKQVLVIVLMNLRD